MAITHNYVSYSNLGNVLMFLERKRSHISGCRDRSEAIAPDRLRDEFVDALRLGIESGVIDEERFAAAMFQRGWTCDAWNDGGDNAGDDSGDRSSCEGRVDDGPGGGDEPDGRPSKRSKTTTSTGLITESSTSSIMSKTEKVSSFSFSFL